MAGGKARLPPRWFVVTAWHLHRQIVRASRGRKGLWPPRPGKWGALRLTTRGRRSRKPRSVILGYYEDGDNLVSMAMNGWGAPEPAWWMNLQARPGAVPSSWLAGFGATYSAGPQWAASVNGCGNAGANWTRIWTATLHGDPMRRRYSYSSRAVAGQATHSSTPKPEPGLG
jgi:hypothetical protein